ncbi:MAG: S8 family serine peptidase [Candidatus Schekmanbacteria bacterium]|nr:S8 family serine peptidase [Candidatus Schekmanbacteria bacterium]
MSINGRHFLGPAALFVFLTLAAHLGGAHRLARAADPAASCTRGVAAAGATLLVKLTPGSAAGLALETGSFSASAFDLPDTVFVRPLHPEHHQLAAVAAARLGASHPARLARARTLAADLARTLAITASTSSEAETIRRRLEQRRDVAWVARDGLVHATDIMPDDPKMSEEWGLNNTGQDGGAADVDIDAPAAWEVTTGSATVQVAILDSGLDLGNRDVLDRIDLVAGADLVNGDDDPTDDAGHGTHVTGIGVAEGDDAAGIAGVCWACRVMPIKVLDAQGTGTFSDIATGISRAVANGARVLNLSLGAATSSPAIQDAIDLATAAGAVVIAATGNAGTDAPFYPAANDNVFAVAAIDRTGARASFSSYGDWVDAGAPGVAIWSALPGNAYASWQGTSMAAPFMSGVAGLLLSEHPTWNAHLIMQQLTRTAKALPAIGVGAGMPSAYLALATPVAPEVAIATTAVSDPAPGDGDGRIDTGESVTLAITLRSDYGNVANLSGTLSTAAAGVTLADDTATWPDLESGESVTNSADTFAVEVAPGAEAGSDLSFTLDLTGSAGFAAQVSLALAIDGGVELPASEFCVDTALAKNVYMVREDVHVCAGSTLAIAPGTTLKVERQTPPIEIAIDGRLVAAGTEDEPILFTSAAPDAQAGDWGAISFRDSSDDAIGWQRAVSVPAGTQPQDVALGDVDGSGSLDMVAASYYSNAATILTWTGSGWDEHTESVGERPAGIAVGDADNDGDLDIVTANEATDDVTVLERDGSAWVREDLASQPGPQAVAVGDVDNDGDNDIVVANGWFGSASVFRWSGSGWVRKDLPAGSWPRGVAIGDADDDGDLDFAVANGWSDSVTLFRWDGADWTAEEIAVGWGPWRVAIADVDGDGKNDIATANEETNDVTVLRLTSSGHARYTLAAGASPFGIAIGDLDGDGSSEIVVTNSGAATASILTWGGARRDVAVGSVPMGVAIGAVGDGSLGNIALASSSTDAVESYVPLSPLGGSRVAHAVVQYGAGFALTGASPYLADLTLGDTTDGILGDAASHPLLERLDLARVAGTAVSAGAGATLKDSTVSAGVLSVGAVIGSNLSSCGNLTALFITATDVDSCGDVNAFLLDSSVADSGNVTGSLLRATVTRSQSVASTSVSGSAITENAGGVSGTRYISSSIIANNGGGVSTATGSIEQTLVLRNAGDGVSGTAEISSSTIAGNTGSGVVLTGAGSATGSIIDNYDGGSGGRYAVRHTAAGASAFTGSFWGGAASQQMAAADTNGDRSNDEGANIAAIYDWYDATISGLGTVGYDDWRDGPPPGAPAYVQSVTLDPASPVGAQEVDFTFLFSGAMDSSAPPTVTFGVDSPFTDFALSDARWGSTVATDDTLTMTYVIQTETPDGLCWLRVSGVREAGGRDLPDEVPASFVIDTPVGIARGIAVGLGAFGGPAPEGGTRRQGAPVAVVSWQAVEENDLGGYTVLWGTSPGQLTSSRDAGLATTASVSPLDYGMTYYFAVQAREASGLPGPISEVVSLAVPAQLTPTPTTTPTATATPTATTPTATATSTATPTTTPTASATTTPTATATGTPTGTATPVSGPVPLGTPGALGLLIAMLGAALGIRLPMTWRRSMARRSRGTMDS